MSLQLLFLGAFQVLRNGNPITSFRSVNVQGLLAYLALEADRPHPREHLAALFWPEEADTIAKQNLRQTLYLLRQSLGEDPNTEPFLLIARASVQFNPKSQFTLDVAAFDAALAADNLETAADLYRGDLLTGLYCDSADFEDWLLMQREHRHQQALSVFQQLAEQKLAQQDHEQVRHYAQRQLEMEPWREVAHRQLMRTLAAMGDRTGALTQYERCRQMMLDHLGVEPTQETTDLFHAIRADHLTGTATNTPILLPSPPQHNLPPTLTPFVGRSEEVRSVAELLQSDARLVTILGEGGIGKTRLALAVAEVTTNAFVDGVRFVPLAGVMDEKELPNPNTALLEDALITAIAAACGVAFAGDEPLRQRLSHHLQARQMLLVLDNFEHLVAAAPFLLTLLQHAPHLSILVTSRIRLNAHSEHVVPLMGLPAPAEDNDPNMQRYSSVQLFLQTAQRSSARLTLDEETLGVVGQICRHVQGIPLGIELAAAQVEELTPQEIKAAIEQNLDVLAAPHIDLPARHHSLRAVFDSSWQLLSAEEGALLARLSVFTSTFTREAALTISAATPTALTALIHKSLLRRQANGRYTLHALLRQFAAEKLADRGDADAIQQDHAFYYLRFLARMENLLSGEKSVAALAEIQQELDNVRQAWTWAIEGGLWQALDVGANGLVRFLIISSRYEEGERALARAIEALMAHLHSTPPQADETDLPRLHGTLYAWHAFFLNTQARYEEAVTAARAAVTLGEKQQFTPVVALGHLHWGLAHWNAGSVAQAQPLVERALVLAQSDGLPRVEIDSLRLLGSIALRTGDHAEALRLYRRSLHIARKIEDRHRESQALHSLGGVTRNHGQYSEARTYVQESLRIYRALEDRRGESSALNTLGDTAYYQGYYMTARSFYEQALEIAQEIDEQRQVSMVLTNLGILHRDLGDFLRGERFLDQALAIKEEIGFHRGQGWIWICLALLRHQRGENEEAHTYSQRALALFQMLGDHIGQAYALTQCGHACAGLGQLDDAELAYRHTLTLRHELKQPHLTLDLKAGLARIALHRNQVDEAIAWVDEILAFLQNNVIDGSDEPGRIYLTCYHVLTAADDPRAGAVLREAQQFLQERAMRINDPALRRSYLEAIPAHQEILSQIHPTY